MDSSLAYPSLKVRMLYLWWLITEPSMLISFPLTTKSRSSSVTNLFFKHVYKLHMVPCHIICDRDEMFVTHFWK